MRGLIVLLWRGGLRISEALSHAGRDLDSSRGSVVVRHGKGDKRREIGMDDWGWEYLRPWLDRRIAYPVGALLCIVERPLVGPSSACWRGSRPAATALPRAHRHREPLGVALGGVAALREAHRAGALLPTRGTGRRTSAPSTPRSRLDGWRDKRVKPRRRVLRSRSRRRPELARTTRGKPQAPYFLAGSK